eukprot:160638_1
MPDEKAIRFLADSWIIEVYDEQLTYYAPQSSALPEKIVNWTYSKNHQTFDVTFLIEIACSKSLSPVTAPTSAPTFSPTHAPTYDPTIAPSNYPTSLPTTAPMFSP